MKVVLFVLVIFVIIYIFIKLKFKNIKVPCVCLITGGVKTGKSLLSVNLSVKDYKWRHFKWRIAKLFGKKKEEPLYYTNTAISFGSLKSKKPHRLDKNIRKIELEHLLRDKRFNYGSVVYFCESSLTADSQDYQNQKRNAELSLFNKLFGHETKGGVLYYDTQSPADNHYSIKRVVSTYFFIQKSKDFFFFRILFVRELINNDIGENDFNEDVDFTMRRVIVPRWYYKKYDRYYFSYLTDKLSKKSKRPKWYKGSLTSFNPLYVELSNKSTKKKGVL